MQDKFTTDSSQVRVAVVSLYHDYMPQGKAIMLIIAP